MAASQFAGRDGSTAHIASRETIWNRPEFGVQGLKTMADQIIGVPLVADASRPFPNYFGEGPHFAHSAAQCFIGTNRTTLPTQIILQQILAGNWYTQIVAPLTPLPWSSSGTIQFDTLQFGPQLPQVVPEEGKTRIGKWEYDSKNFTVQRYGLGARFTHDFLLTPNGLARARGIMDQMQVSIEDHLKIGVLHALLHCRDAANARIAESYHNPTLSQQEMNLQHTIDFFGILQFRDDGVTRLLNEAKKTMRSIQGDYDTAIVHYLQQVYCVNLNPKMTTYSEVGPVAYENFTAIVGENRRFGDANGPRTFLVEEFAHGKGKAPLDFLRRKIVVGHYALMFDHVPASNGGRYSNWGPGCRDIQIMSGDNGGDERVTISFEAALRATGAWDEETGELIGPDHPSLTINGDHRPLGAEGNRCSFWFLNPATRKEEVVRHIGGMSDKFFASWNSMADTVFKTLPARNEAEVTSAIYTIASDIETMANMPVNESAKAWVVACAASPSGFPTVRPSGFSSPLPPWMATGAALRALRDYTQATQDSVITGLGLSAERLKSLARAVNVVQTYLVPHMLAGFGPNNAFLGNGSVEDAFDGFIDNCLAGHLLPLSTIAPTSVADPQQFIDTETERGDQRSATLSQAATRFQSTVTGFLTLGGPLVRAHKFGKEEPRIPPVRASLAKFSDDADKSSVAFDPFQGRKDAMAKTFEELQAMLPEYARTALDGEQLDKAVSLPSEIEAKNLKEQIMASAFEEAKRAEYGRLYDQKKMEILNIQKEKYDRTPDDEKEKWLNDQMASHVALLVSQAAERAKKIVDDWMNNPGTQLSRDLAENLKKPRATLYYYKDQAVNVESASYKTLVRVLLNLLTHSDASPSQLAARAAVLSLLAQLKPREGNYKAALTALDLKREDLDVIKTNYEFIPDALRNNNGIKQLISANAFTSITLPGRPPQNMTMDYLVAGLKKIMSSVVTEAEGSSAPHVNDLIPSNYVDGFYRASIKSVLNARFNKLVLPARPRGSGPVANDQELKNLQDSIRSSPPGTYGAANMMSTSASTVLAGRAYAPLVNLPLAVMGTPGGLPDVSEYVLSEGGYPHEAYRSEVPGDPGSVGRYRVPGGALPPRSIAASQRLPSGLSDICTPNMKRSWELINRTVHNIAYAAVARVACVTPTNFANMLAMLVVGFLIPFTVIIARPFGVFHTKVMFLLKAGIETMRTILGQPNTTWANDAGHQAFELTITFKSRTIVTKPENVLQINNAFFCGYEGGMGATFFTPRTLAAYLAKGDLSAPHDSIIPILEPYEPYVRHRPPRVFSLIGNFEDSSPYLRFADSPIMNKAQHYYNHGYARAKWGFPSHALQSFFRDEGVRNMQQFVHGLNEHDAFFSRVDFTVWKDQSLHVNPDTGLFTIMSPARGLFPNDRIGPGFFDGLRGTWKVIPRQTDIDRYTKVHG